MSSLFLDISISLDGYVAGPDQTLDAPLGRGGEQLHEWAFATRAFRRIHDMEDGESGADDEIAAEFVERSGATVMGRHMFSGGAGPWEDDPNAYGWWGDDPPFHHAVFVLTHHEREPLEMEGGTTFTFVTDGIESALEQARAAAGGRDVLIAGGARAAQQYLAAGLIDEIQLHVAPVLLGSGARLFERHLGDPPRPLQLASALTGEDGTVHAFYR